MFDFLFKKNTKSVGGSSAEISNAQTKLVVLMILDGLGITSDEEGNSVLKAKTPFLDTVWTKGRKTLLHASGTPVGLPDGEVGNSEVGHLNIGAGRVVYQSLPRINDAIMSGQFKKHPVFLDALKEAKKRGSKVHLMGILSAGGVHGHISHLFELLDMCKDNGVNPYVHAFLDGRDTGMTDGYFYVSKLMSKMKELKTGKLASLIGRFYAMDRDNRWERINLAYDAMTGKGKRTAKDPFEIIQEAYKKSENDQIFVPTTMVDENGKPVGAIEDGDIAIIFNFREDRSREIIKAFVQKDFTFFKRSHSPEKIYFVSMMGYAEGLEMKIVFPPKLIDDSLSSVLSGKNLKQLHISETEKFAHVTYFFNGGVEKPYPGEDVFNIPSRKVFDYAETPEMSAGIIRDEVVYRLDHLDKNGYSFIVINFANPDMLGHTGDLNKAIQANEFTDLCVKDIVTKVAEVGGISLIIADHGNCEVMVDKMTGKPDTKHTNNPIPFIMVSKKEECVLSKDDKVLRIGLGGDSNPTGMLADVAPTALNLLGVEPPASMTGVNLLDVI